MNTTLYYPGFEVKDINWLKFALLYIRKLRPIIPLSGDNDLSEITHRINEETDLFSYYRPTFQESYEASEIAYDVVSRFLLEPERYRYRFKKFNTDAYFKDLQTHNFLLYNEKFTYHFANFCINNGYATESSKGILINEEIGNIYMSILANIISEKNQIHCITDMPNMDRYNIYIRDIGNLAFNTDINLNRNYRIEKIARSVIELYIPKGISNIDLNTIIQFRASNDYSVALEAFHNEIDRYLNMLEGNESITEFEERINNSIRRLKRELLVLFPQLTLIAFQVWSIINGNLTAEHLAATSVSATSAIYTTSNLRDIYVSGENARFTRKYLSTLKRTFADKEFIHHY
jgi:hypothetical protein